MKVKMLIASDDTKYTMKLSEQISKNHSDTLEVATCSNMDELEKAIHFGKGDVALIDHSFIKYIDLIDAILPIMLHSETEIDEAPAELLRTQKYRRISALVADILEIYSKVSKTAILGVGKTADITAVWSPAGGVGKTTVALAAAESAIQMGKRVFYLNLEIFSSIPIYFNDARKSISTVFEMLESDEGNVKMLISAITEEENGITYLGMPSNYDDINILTAKNIEDLIITCGALADELIIDLSLPCDSRTTKVFELANKVLLVTDGTATAKAKLSQFVYQNNVFGSITEKITVIANKGTEMDDKTMHSVNSLPHVSVSSETQLYKELAAHLQTFTAWRHQ